MAARSPSSPPRPVLTGRALEQVKADFVYSGYVKLPIRWAAEHDGRDFVRVSRMPVPDTDVPNRGSRAGTAELHHDGGESTIIANGATVQVAAAASDRFRTEGIGVRVLNMAPVNPIDENSRGSGRGTGPIVTVEEAHVRGGLGGAVAEGTASNSPVRVAHGLRPHCGTGPLQAR
jgi:transketolase